MQIDSGGSAPATPDPRRPARAENLRLLPDRVGSGTAARHDPDLQPDGHPPTGARAQGLSRDAAPRMGPPLRFHRSSARPLATYLRLLRALPRSGGDSGLWLRRPAKPRLTACGYS